MGDCAGEEGLFKDFKWRTTAVAKSRSLLLHLSRVMFTNTLDMLPTTKTALMDGYSHIQTLVSPSKLALIWPFVGLTQVRLEVGISP